MRHSSEQSKVPAIIAKAEFLAPLMVTCPDRGFPPQICKTDLFSSGRKLESGVPIGKVMVLSSKIRQFYFSKYKFGSDSTGKFGFVQKSKAGSARSQFTPIPCVCRFIR